MRAVLAFVRLLAWLALPAFLLPAAAHTRSESFAQWEVASVGGAREVRLTYTLPDVEAVRLGTPPGSRPDGARLIAYLGERVSAQAGGVRCPAAGAARDVAASRGFRRIEFAYACPAGTQPLVLHSAAFFDLVPSHVIYARLRDVTQVTQVTQATQAGEGAQAAFVEQLVTAEQRDIETGTGHAAPKNPGLLEYALLGVEHILTGPDHIAFVLGLVLISRRLRDLTLVVTGFTVGHSVTLALAVSGAFRPQPEAIDVMIALTIALIGAENVSAASRSPRIVAGLTGALLLAMAAARLAGVGAMPVPLLAGASLFALSYLLLAGRLEDAAWLRAGITLVFGLIHGFAFANDLIEMKLPPGRLVELLLSFNLGVEAGQLLVVGLILAASALLVRLRLALPRPLVTDVTAAGLVGLGSFWLVSRIYS